MQQRRMGRTGLKVSEICLGTMTFAGQSDEATSLRILDVAAERGVTFLDTADVYPIPPDLETAGRTEEVIGRWLAAAPGRRDQFVVATKCRARVGHRAQRPGTVAPAHPGRLRGQPPPASDRLHRSLPGPFARPGDADRRDPARLRRPGALGEGPLHRLLELSRPGSSLWHSEPASGTAGRDTTASSRATTCCTARSRPSCCRSAATRGWA